MDPRGTAMASRQAALRERQGPGAFGYGGQSYDATSKSLDADRGGLLLLEGEGNANSIDQRLVTLNPADFPNAQVLGTDPKEGSLCTWQGHPYVVKKVLDCEVAFGSEIALPIVIYRAPDGDAATVSPTGETGAGTRKEYYPRAQS